MKKYHVTKNNVFEDIGFNEIEAANLKARAGLILAIKRYIQKHKLTQAQAAKCFGIDQPQISRLLQGKIGHFSIDKLLAMLSRVNITVQWKIAA